MAQDNRVLMLPSDYRRLKEAVSEHENRYRTTLAGTADAVDISSETWHDNPAFDEIQQQAKMSFNQFKKLEVVLKDAVVIDVPPADGSAQIGTRIVFSWNGDDTDTDSIVLTGYAVPGSPEEEVSTASPLGQLLLGAKPGDLVQGKINDRKVRLKITSVEPALEYF